MEMSGTRVAGELFRSPLGRVRAADSRRQWRYLIAVSRVRNGSFRRCLSGCLHSLRHSPRIDEPCSPKPYHQPAPTALPLRRAWACGARLGRAGKTSVPKPVEQIRACGTDDDGPARRHTTRHDQFVIWSRLFEQRWSTSGWHRGAGPRRRVRSLTTTALVNRNVHHHRPGLHELHHVAPNQPRYRNPGDQHRSNY